MFLTRVSGRGVAAGDITQLKMIQVGLLVIRLPAFDINHILFVQH